MNQKTLNLGTFGFTDLIVFQADLIVNSQFYAATLHRTSFPQLRTEFGEYSQ